MEIIYKNKRVEKQFDPAFKQTWTYPKQVQLKLEAAENFIRHAVSLADLAVYAPYHLEKLLGDRLGQWSIRVGHTGYRVLFYPCDADGEPLLSGDVLAACRSIHIVLITEVSNHYE